MFPDAFANDLPAKKAAVLAAAQRPVAFSALVTPSGVPAWQTIPSWDLVGTIETNQIPIDDPLPFKLTDVRQVRTAAANDGVWVRPIDVARSLSSRTYGVECEAVIEVADELFGDARYLLHAGPHAATCTPTDHPADVRMSVAALGSAYLGGNRLLTLAAAGRVEAADTALLSQLDRAFLADRAPFHGTAF